MTPSEIIRQIAIDAAVVLVEGQHDGIGDAILDALAEHGWLVAKVQPVVLEGELLFRIVEEAR